MKNPNSPSRDFQKIANFVGVFATGVLMTAVVGGLSNTINGVVSPLYFVLVMQWQDSASSVWRASIVQGVLEGLVSGTILSLIFTTVVGLISRLSCPYIVSVRYIAGMIAFACGGWLLGGAGGMLLALFSPTLFVSGFGAPREVSELVRFAWVGGSIWGIYSGAVVSLVLTLVTFKVNWRGQPFNTRASDLATGSPQDA